ncbi:hypothetical protein F4561_005907 [Lipingzhangella halophila]|uniref:DUF3558 domain-containing protein n=1 Tax=Lipingzhangella halophila TaxID=1783352 RepID=A0A7W7RN15_9ACTN|nr:hypothetical protein [Lipingzhangella halophila]MBB4935013.1 hypothetical protein [Lipingzhangella halophila]
MASQPPTPPSGPDGSPAQPPEGDPPGGPSPAPSQQDPPSEERAQPSSPRSGDGTPLDGPHGEGPAGPPPSSESPRRNGALVAGIAGGAALLLVVAGAVAWSITRPGPAYAAMDECADYLPEELLAEYPELGDQATDLGTDSDGDKVVAEALRCGATSESGESPGAVLVLDVERFDPETRDGGYADVRDTIWDRNRQVDEQLGEDGRGEAVDLDDGQVGDVRMRENELGDGGRSALVTGTRRAGDDEEPAVPGGAFASVAFSDRNLLVSVRLIGGSEQEPEETLDAATGIAEAVDERVTESEATV